MMRMIFYYHNRQSELSLPNVKNNFIEMKQSIFSLLFILLSSFTALAGSKITVVSGNLKDLGGETEFNLEYDFSSYGVGAYATEEEYIQYEKKRIAEKDGQERAEDWEKKWRANADLHYKSMFELLANGDNIIHIAANNSKAKYTLILKTTYMEPGFNVGVVRKSAHIHVEYIFVEKDNPTKEIARLAAKKIPGADAMGFDFAVSDRVKESYAKAGKMLSKYFKKYAKKE
jgi:hypothetical protein